MAAFSLKIQGIDAAIDEYKNRSENLEADVQGELDAWAIKTSTIAKELAPVDEGHLKQSIHPEFEKNKASVTVNVDYAAYLEFGTRKFAAIYVATLPQDWQTFASQYRGSGGGSFGQFVMELTEWVRRKGISGTYSVKTQRRTGSKISQESEDHEMAYRIALKIVRNGIKPQPFLYPAAKQTTPVLIQNIKKLLQ